MNLNREFEDVSQLYGKLSELWHKLADSGNFMPGSNTSYQSELTSDITRINALLDQKRSDIDLEFDRLTEGDPDEPGEAETPGEGSSEPEPPREGEGQNGGPVVEVPGDIPNPIEEPPANAVLVQAQAMWLGSWLNDVWETVRNAVEHAAGTTSVFIAYNVVNRDNGNYSAGGLHTRSEYWEWSGKIADAIGVAPAVAIVEPDALGLLDGLNNDQKIERYACIQGAIDAYNTKPNIKIYVDASVWVNPAEMARRLQLLSGMDGFSCNVSGYEDTAKVMAWAEEVSRLTGLHYIIDTARNGNGNPHPGKWCNVTDTKVGVTSTAMTASRNCDLYLWCKVPGESDGKGINDDGSHPRNDVPNAGDPFPQYKKAIYDGSKPAWDEFKQQFKV